MDWVLFALWAVTGLMTLCTSAPVSKLNYGATWIVLMLELLLDAVRKVALK